MIIGCADFETTTDPEDCRIWAWGIMPIYDDWEVYGNSIADFVNATADNSFTLYFHNLAFDCVFIIDYLLRNGWKWVRKNPQKYEFTTLIDKMNKVFSVEYVREGRTILYDSYKKIPLPVASMPKTFNLPENEVKLDIDYVAYRPCNHIMSDEETAYLANDILICRDSMKVVLNMGMDRITLGSDCLQEYKKLNPDFRKMFPKLSNVQDEFCRKAYKGGFTYCSPRYHYQLVGEGEVFDVNSLYPYVMYTAKLPYGKPLKKSGSPLNSDKLWIARALIMFTLKPDHIPCIQIRGSSNFLPSKYVEECDEPVEMTFTSIDWELWNEQYDIDVLQWDSYYEFNSAIGLFKKYIDKWSKVKQESLGGVRLMAKLHLNMLYGKFGKSRDNSVREPVMENDRVEYKLIQDDNGKTVYVPMAAFITAYARAKTVRAAQAHYEDFCYADTDSLHLLGVCERNLDVHDSELGAWKREKVFDSAYFAHAKCYLEHDDEGWETHIAGVPRSEAAKITPDMLIDGATIATKLLPKRVPHGIVLVETEFTFNRVD